MKPARPVSRTADTIDKGLSMKEINFDCLKDDGFKYNSLYNEKLGNPDGCERKKPQLREKDELFAFKWPNLPKRV